jgi:opacity protein-like surface antigen
LKIKRSTRILFLLLLGAGATFAHGQVVPSASGGQFAVTVGGMGSVFQPDYAGYGVAQTSPNRLYGIAAFVDVKFTHWIQLETEGRWLRFNQFESIYEDNYLAGPRVPLHTFKFMQATPYAKVLIGIGKMNFENNDAYGRFTDIAYGGGADFRLTDRISLRGDFEYQQWPAWLNSQLSPYGASAGVSYRILGGRHGLRKLTRKERGQ